MRKVLLTICIVAVLFAGCDILSGSGGTGNSGTGGGGGSGSPNLTITASADRSSVSAGGRVTINFTVANSGTAASSATTVNIYASRDTTITTSDTSFARNALTLPVLAAGARQTGRYTLTLSNAGTFNYGICIAATGRCSSAITITVAGPPADAACTVGTQLSEGERCIVGRNTYTQNSGRCCWGALCSAGGAVTFNGVTIIEKSGSVCIVRRLQ